LKFDSGSDDDDDDDGVDDAYDAVCVRGVESSMPPPPY
jgi:hypothetical protein